MFKKSVRPTVEERVIHISGTVRTRESRQPLSSLIIKVYSINLRALRGEHRSWAKNLENSHVVAQVADDVTSEGGTFSATVDLERALGDLPTFGIVVLPPDASSGDSPTPLFTSPTPLVADRFRLVNITIPVQLPESAGIEPQRSPSLSDVLDAAQTPATDTADWFRRHNKLRTDSLQQFTKVSSAAFANFTPSVISEAMRARHGYLKPGDSLPRTLEKMRRNALESWHKHDIVKKRRVRLPREVLEKWDVKKTQKHALSGRDVATILRRAQPSPAAALQYAIANEEKRKIRDDEMINQLCNYITKRIRSGAHLPSDEEGVQTVENKKEKRS